MALNQESLDRLKIDRGSRGELRARRSPIGLWVGLVVLILIGLGGYRWYAGQGVRPEVRTVSVQIQENGSGDASARTVLNASGYVTPRRTATVSSKITGKVVEVLVEEGMHVVTNQVLARLDDSNLVANRKLAEAQLGSAKIAVRETQALFEEAQSRFKRISSLAQAGVETAASLEKVESELKSFQARYERLKLEITVAERALGLWDQQLEDVTIRAPFSGVVTAKNAQPGEVVSPMSSGGFTRTGICTIVDMESLEIEVDVNESFLNRVKAGQRVEAMLDAYPDWKIPCKVIAIIPTADRQKATVKVRVGFEKLDERILPQMGVKVAFRGEEKPEPAVASSGVAKSVITVPKGAVQQRDGVSVAWVVKEERVERRAVTVETGRGDTLVVVAGLKAGERVIVDAPSTVADGVKIREARK